MDYGIGVLLFAVVAIGVVVAIATFVGSGALYDRIGKGAFSLDTPDRPKGPAPGSAQAIAESEEEVRQLVEAKSARRVARGQAPLDVDREVESLLHPAAPDIDPALREEIRSLVIARNERRARRGEAPLDVEAEIEREIRDFGG
jgi:hypothetical protein